MTISEIKAAIGVKVINLQQQFDLSGEATEWWRSFDMDSAIEVVVHEDLLPIIKTDDNLSIREQTKVFNLKKGGTLEVKSYLIVKYKSDVVSL